jgi:exopolyphosphatase/guanosine-5'-triphosphate,3'-diphosphate pyrophosphatase
VAETVHARPAPLRPVPPAPAAGAPPESLQALLPAVLAMGEKYHYDGAHGRHVAELAEQLFAALQPFHGLPPSWRLPLQHAALLHDIGYFVAARRHHRHSRHLIRHDALLDDYPAPWREFVALVAGNHRRRVRRAPRAWGRERRRAATVLAAILRLADGLDYGHDGAAAVAGVRVRRGTLQIRVTGLRPQDLRPVLRRKAGLFARTFAVPVTFV